MCTTANNREIIEPRIIQLVRELTAAPATDEVADALKPVMEQVVDQAASSSQGGKRLRALLALDAFDILAGDVTPDRRDAMIDLACAIEVFQTAALVHDDIIDESDLRRGRPSAHRALEQAVHSGAIGRGLGLMLGDILATACIEITRRSASRLPNTDALNEAFLTMQREVETRPGTGLGRRDDPTVQSRSSGERLIERIPLEDSQLHHHRSTAACTAGRRREPGSGQALRVGRRPAARTGVPTGG